MKNEKKLKYKSKYQFDKYFVIIFTPDQTTMKNK